MDVQRLPQVALAHRRALDVPTRAAEAERSVPGRAQSLVDGLRLLPQREVADRLLVVLVGHNPHPSPEAAAVQVREGAIRWEARDPKVHVTIGDVCVLVLDE